MLLHHARVACHLELGHVLLRVHVAVRALVCLFTENHLLRVVGRVALVLVDYQG